MDTVMNTYLILRPRSASSKLALSLVKDSGGRVIGRNELGLLVRCRKGVADQLDLIQVVGVSYA